MVGPSPLPQTSEAKLDEKQRLRTELRARRRAHVAALPQATRRLLFLRPPAPIAALAPPGATVGLYHATPDEAPAGAYARWFAENGRPIALPWFADGEAAMTFREWSNPWDDSSLVRGPHRVLQPRSEARECSPDVVFVPLVGFTAHGERLGQGGGHYDRWLAAHPATTAIGMAWDCQLCDSLPLEPHDRRLRAVVTPTRFHEGD